MHRPSLLAFAAVLIGAMPPHAFAGHPQTVASFERTITKQVGYTYLLSLPTGYEADTTKTWPLLVFLHGSGERGSDPWLVAKHGPPMLLRGLNSTTSPDTPEARARRAASATALAESFIVVSPQCPAGTRWTDDAVLALVDEISARHRVDAHRIYLTGLSMGGYGTWSVGVKNPHRFAAIVPICGGGGRIDVIIGDSTNKTALQSLGIWAFHGAKDPTVPLSESENMVEALKKRGVTNVKLTVYPDAKHDSWTETYDNPELYTWLLQHRR